MLPRHLAKTQAQGLVFNEPIAQYLQGGRMRNFVYLLLDWDNKVAAWIDPQIEVPEIIKDLSSKGFQLEWVLLTHTHFDHVAGLPELLSLFPKLKLGVHALELHRIKKNLPSPFQGLNLLEDNQILDLGQWRIEVLHTPGHSAGECCYNVKTHKHSYLFTGDTVFIRDCGRTDLETGSDRELFETLNRLKKLPPETIILPGHQYQPECASTLEKEMLESPPFLCQSVEELRALP